jgi:uncharacterized RDD family membrane protein YckC
MAYEGVLLFGVVFVVSYAVLALAQWTYPLTDARRAILQAVLFVTLGAYFVYQWSRTGQTLAMKSWHLRLVDRTGAPPSPGRAIGRYVAAWHLWVPGALFAAFSSDAMLNLVALVAGFLLLMLPAALASRRRALHDALSQTFVVRER